MKYLLDHFVFTKVLCGSEKKDAVKMYFYNPDCMFERCHCIVLFERFVIDYIMHNMLIPPCTIENEREYDAHVLNENAYNDFSSVDAVMVEVKFPCLAEHIFKKDCQGNPIRSDRVYVFALIRSQDPMVFVPGFEPEVIMHNIYYSYWKPIQEPA